jgi:hypothetical protein
MAISTGLGVKDVIGNNFVQAKLGVLGKLTYGAAMGGCNVLRDAEVILGARSC